MNLRVRRHVAGGMWQEPVEAVLLSLRITGTATHRLGGSSGVTIAEL